MIKLLIICVVMSVPAVTRVGNDPGMRMSPVSITSVITSTEQVIFLSWFVYLLAGLSICLLVGLHR